jgi:hypothetical protein
MWMDGARQCGRLFVMAVAQVIFSVVEFVLSQVLTFLGKSVTEDPSSHSRVQYVSTTS